MIAISKISSEIGKLKGLMFTFPISEDRAVLFEFEKPERRPVHTYFVFYPINIYWLDKNYNVIDSVYISSFQKYYPKLKAKYVLETHVDNYFEIGKNIKEVLSWPKERKQKELLNEKKDKDIFFS